MFSQPRFAPAMIAELFARPTGAAVRAPVQYNTPRILAGVELPDLDQACTVFADAFLRAVAVDPTAGGPEIVAPVA